MAEVLSVGIKPKRIILKYVKTNLLGKICPVLTTFSFRQIKFKSL